MGNRTGVSVSQANNCAFISKSILGHLGTKLTFLDLQNVVLNNAKFNMTLKKIGFGGHGESNLGHWELKISTLPIQPPHVSNMRG